MFSDAEGELLGPFFLLIGEGLEDCSSAALFLSCGGWRRWTPVDLQLHGQKAFCAIQTVKLCSYQVLTISGYEKENMRHWQVGVKVQL